MAFVLDASVAVGWVVARQSSAYSRALRLRAENATVLLVDQMAGLALALADRGYVIEGGRITAHGSSAEIAADGALEKAYLGG